MIPVVQLENIIAHFDQELSQEGNENAYTRLFLVRGTNNLAKICYKNERLWEKNITNLRFMCRELNPVLFPELVFPTSLIEHDGRIVGYSMPYIEGETLSERIRSRHESKFLVMRWFDQIGSLINRLPNGIYIGDLHGGNIIIDRTSHVRLIDIDGFSVERENIMTCPMHYNDFLLRNLPYEKYYNPDGSTKIGKNSDIYCWFSLIFDYLLDGLNPFHFSPRRLRMFIKYLEDKKVPVSFLAMLQQITGPQNNYITQDICASLIKSCGSISYGDFLTSGNLSEEEDLLGRYISTIINERCAKSWSGHTILEDTAGV